MREYEISWGLREPVYSAHRDGLVNVEDEDVNMSYSCKNNNFRLNLGDGSAKVYAAREQLRTF